MFHVVFYLSVDNHIYILVKIIDFFIQFLGNNIFIFAIIWLNKQDKKNHASNVDSNWQKQCSAPRIVKTLFKNNGSYPGKVSETIWVENGHKYGLRDLI